jgi:hypothetical protein
MASHSIGPHNQPTRKCRRARDHQSESFFI